MKRLVTAAAVLLSSVLPASVALVGCDTVTPSALTPTTGAVSGTVEVDDTPVLDHRGIGAVRLGMTFEQLQATGEVGGEVGGAEFACPVYALKVVPGWVGVEDGVVVDIRVEANARTREDLRLGDSRARMHEVYPDVEQNPHGFIQELDDARYQFFFVNAGDILTGIGLTRPDTGCLN